ncbi:hypothetical protein HD806DRAFT_510191 [Xylariaceae sp. AK1471]|nr:hypothetical protein HD806DRAFT_510191 [Xylariaceae sp. AK1471]
MSDQDAHELTQSGSGKTPRGRARLPSSRRRDKPQLSCNLCKRMKLRCDRQQPCGTCEKRGLSLSCAYMQGSSTSLLADASGPSQRSPVTVQGRIHQLENLVMSMMQQASTGPAGAITSQPDPEQTATPQHNSSYGPPPVEDLTDNVVPVPPNVGSIQLTHSGASYVSGAHWAAVLDGIAELKDHFAMEERQVFLANREALDLLLPDLNGPLLLYGCVMFATREEILASLPARPVVEQLVSHYFDSFEMSPAVLHSNEFLKEFERFWENPSETPIIWIGLLFTILCLATQFQKCKSTPQTTQGQASKSSELDLDTTVEAFRQKIVQCLVLGNYAKGGAYVLETLMLYIAVELFARKDAEVGVWILLGTVVQLAMHMGYHRDPKHFKEVTPFEGEMRKRVWATAVELDLALSTQMGLPRLIKQWQADTPEPLNLQDSDFDKSTREMPPSRPESGLTPILYRLVKARMMTTIGLIWDFAADVRPSTYAELMKMDKALQNSYLSIPECLRWRSISQCIIDSSQVIMQKASLDIMFHKARIVLHRRYLHYSPSDSQYSHSRRAGLDAALKLLGFQHMLYTQTQPQCRLHEERWKVSSLVNHDFLLATSVLCLYLQQVRAQNHPPEPETSMMETIHESLRKSHDIWLRSSNSSKEAKKAAEALGVVLGNRAATKVTASTASTPIGDELPILPLHGGSDDVLYNNAVGFGPHFPVFNMGIIQNWADPTGGYSRSTIPIESMPLIDNGPRLMGDIMRSGDWPWNI